MFFKGSVEGSVREHCPAAAVSEVYHVVALCVYVCRGLVEFKICGI